jgi:adenylate cyclase class IV
LVVRNIESKFRCSDHDAVAARAIAAGARDEGFIRQRDQFYGVSRGRLKLRTLDDARSDLIAYDREDNPEARVSDYALYPSDDARALDEVLGRALQRTSLLEKTRHLLIHGMTRIHLDDVDGVGRFVELETVVENQSGAAAEAEHHHVVQLLGLADVERIAVAYVDLSRGSETT